MLKFNKGFTLIEVLVALLIFSFSMATIYWGFSQSIKNSKKAIDLIHEFNEINNFFILNKKEIIQQEAPSFQKDGYEIKKIPLSVMINDSFKLESDRIYKLKIKKIEGIFEFEYTISK